MNAIERGSVLIAAKDFRFSGRRYRHGDKFDYRRMGPAHRRAIAQMLKLKKLDELTQKTMETALRFRDPDAGPPRGFTLAGLKALGILTDDQIASHGWGSRNPDTEITDESEADAPAWEAPEGSWKVFAAGTDEERSTEDTTLWIVPFKTGGAPRYFVHGLDGERLNGDASIGGKAKAEEWARKLMADRAAAEAAKREGDPDWSQFPELEDDWTDAQIEEFDAWYDALQPGAEVVVEHAAVAKLVEERRAAEAREDEIRAGGNAGAATDQANAANVAAEQASNAKTEALGGLTEQELNELLEAMTEDELREHVAQLTGKDPELLKELTPLALREMAVDHQPDTEGTQNGGDVQSGSNDTAG